MALVAAPREELSIVRRGGQQQARTLGFDAVGAPIDVLVPPLFRRSNAIVRGDGEVTCITYADLTAPQPPLEGGGGGGTPPVPRAGESVVEKKPALQLHGDEGGGLGAEAAGRGGGYQFTYKPEEQQSVKQGLLEVLLGAVDGATGDFGSGRPLPAPTMEEEVGIRLQGVHCDATYVTSPLLLLRLVGLILRSRTDPARLMVGCVASIDLSHTVLGAVGAAGPPLHFEGLGPEVGPPWTPAEMRFYPDQPLPWAACPDKVRLRLAPRSLALCYICPLLFVPGAQNYSVRQLACAHCQLTDADAEALAAVIGRKGSEVHQCQLESIDLSFNYITDAGATALLRALEKNHTVTSLLLVGNTGVAKQKTLAKIENRLAVIRKGKRRKRPWLARLFTR